MKFEIRSAERYAAVTRAPPAALRPPQLPAVHPKPPPAPLQGFI